MGDSNKKDAMEVNQLEQQIHQQSDELKSLLDTHVNEWQWDERHQAIQTAFSVDHAEIVSRVLGEYFSDCWQGKTFRKAPPELRHKAGVFAQLSKKQCIYTDTADPQLFAVWWPWGHGATVSVRLFLPDHSPYLPRSGWLDRIKCWFGQ